MGKPGLPSEHAPKVAVRRDAEDDADCTQDQQYQSQRLGGIFSLNGGSAAKGGSVRMLAIASGGSSQGE